jgi:riboflavin biosynthesis pyrimidine reductase
LPPQPDIAILSSSLDFPIPEVLTRGGRRVVFFTTANPDPRRVREIEQQAGRVVVAGEKSVEGTLFVTHMQELGYRVVYSGAGPRILHLLLESRKLDRLYLTFANRLLGGEPFSSLVEGPLLQPAVGLELNTLYFDAHGVDGLGQLFASYDCAPGTPNAP